MPTRLALRVLVLLLALLALVGLPLASVYATHGPTGEQVVAVAQQQGMACEWAGTEVVCDAYDFDGTWHTHASIKPGSGPLASLYTLAAVRVAPLDPYFRGWHFNMHQVGCAPNRTAAGQLSGFVEAVGNLTSAGNMQPLTIAGECNLTGGMTEFFTPEGLKYYHYWINAVVIVPPPPTPVPTPAPTPPPVVTPPPTATPSPVPTAPPRPSASASPSATATTTPTPTPAAAPTPTPRSSASATPEQTVAGITFAPEPSAAVPEVAEDSIPWTASVHGPADVSTEPAALGASAALAMLLLLFMGFVGELFNNTVKAHYDEISGWWRRGWISRLTAAWSALWRGGR